MLQDMRAAFDRLACRVDTVESSVVDLAAAVRTQKTTEDNQDSCKERDRGPADQGEKSKVDNFICILVADS